MSNLLVNTFHKRLLDEGIADSRAPSIARAVQALHSSLCSLSLDSLKELRELHPDLVNLCLRFERDEDKVLNERFDLIYKEVKEVKDDVAELNYHLDQLISEDLNISLEALDARPLSEVEKLRLMYRHHFEEITT